MEKISLVMLAKNEEKNIEACLESVKWVDEIIIIVDADSTDNTVSLAGKFTSKVFIKDWEGFVPQTKFGLSLTTNEWILIFAADERLTPELKAEILQFENEETDGFFIKRKNLLFGKEITTCGWEKDFQLRLFKKSKAKLNERLVQEGFEVDGRTASLKNVIIHNTVSSLHKYLVKVNYTSTLRAEEILKTKKTVSAISIFFHTFSAFFRFFISRKGYKDGMRGIIISFFNSVYTLLIYVKVWEKREIKS
jgi:glycosyltransferase involved in cell wall biosynthesis